MCLCVVRVIYRVVLYGLLFVCCSCVAFCMCVCVLCVWRVIYCVALCAVCRVWDWCAGVFWLNICMCVVCEVLCGVVWFVAGLRV